MYGLGSGLLRRTGSNRSHLVLKRKMALPARGLTVIITTSSMQQATRNRHSPSATILRRVICLLFHSPRLGA